MSKPRIITCPAHGYMMQLLSIDDHDDHVEANYMCPDGCTLNVKDPVKTRIDLTDRVVDVKLYTLALRKVAGGDLTLGNYKAWIDAESTKEIENGK